MLEYFIYSYGNQILMLILCAIAGTLGHAAKRIWQEHINDDTKRAIARVVVQFVEQVWKSLHGEEKLRKALETAQELLAKKSIDFDADEMVVYIEAAVGEFNEAFRAPLLREDCAKAAYDVPEITIDPDEPDIAPATHSKPGGMTIIAAE